MKFISKILDKYHYSNRSKLALLFCNKVQFFPLFPEPGTCFWGANMVRLSSGRQKKISDVKVGDSVLSCRSKWKLAI